MSAFRAQGELTWKKEKILQELRSVLKISDERHKMELLRVDEDDNLREVSRLKFAQITANPEAINESESSSEEEDLSKQSAKKRVTHSAPSFPVEHSSTAVNLSAYPLPASEGPTDLVSSLKKPPFSSSSSADDSHLRPSSSSAKSSAGAAGTGAATSSSSSNTTLTTSPAKIPVEKPSRPSEEIRKPQASHAQKRPAGQGLANTTTTTTTSTNAANSTTSTTASIPKLSGGPITKGPPPAHGQGQGATSGAGHVASGPIKRQPLEAEEERAISSGDELEMDHDTVEGSNEADEPVDYDMDAADHQPSSGSTLRRKTPIDDPDGFLSDELEEHLPVVDEEEEEELEEIEDEIDDVDPLPPS
eukprot:TRINITY_DN651_c0_g1_i4.p1 TRINITY_DN651_c0_g1~~TRINITY_DN651_c0_g1_i4.p1  ORF type:complete len:361 (-),score=142.29 TRINITY_DN651_c0_g1_i4:52-1134(-)